MRASFHHLLLMIPVMSIATDISGQPGVSGYDSVIFIKPKPKVDLYNFFDNGEREIQLWGKKPELIHDRVKYTLNNAGSGLLTVLTGIGFGSGTDITWKFEGTIKCNDSLPDWRVILFCEGYREKTRERVKNDDGSWSVETQETNVHYWNKDANGIIIEGTDTIGYFLLNMDPRRDTLFKPWSTDIFSSKEAPRNFKSENKWSISRPPDPNIDYATIGTFRNNNFILIRNSKDRQAWIFIDNVLTSMFQSEMKYLPNGKKNIFLSYLLSDKNILPADKRDQFRLAMMNRFLNNTITLK